jgi:hypothetical protein
MPRNGAVSSRPRQAGAKPDPFHRSSFALVSSRSPDPLVCICNAGFGDQPAGERDCVARADEAAVPRQQARRRSQVVHLISVVASRARARVRGEARAPVSVSSSSPTELATRSGCICRSRLRPGRARIPALPVRQAEGDSVRRGRAAPADRADRRRRGESRAVAQARAS